jgi:hypothetical protein
MIQNFEIILGPGGTSIGGWTIHRRGEERSLDAQELSALPQPIEVDYRCRGELKGQGTLNPRGRWWHQMDEELVYYSGELLPLSIARSHAQAPITESDRKIQLLLSSKEKYFTLLGETTLSLSGDWPQFDEAKAMYFYEKIGQSWQRAIARFNPGLPKSFRARSPEERETLEVFLLELEHERVPAQVYAKYLPLLERYAGNERFVHWLAKAIARREKPDPVLSLQYNLLRGWLHRFLWGYDNNDRIEILIHVCGMPTGLKVEKVKTTAGRMGLKGFSNFRRAYPIAPFKFERWRGNRWRESEHQPRE